MHPSHALSLCLHADKGFHHTLTTQTCGQMYVFPNNLVTSRGKVVPGIKIKLRLDTETEVMTSKQTSLTLLSSFQSHRVSQRLPAAAANLFTLTHGQAYTHKAGLPCRSLIILWSWLSPAVAPVAMATLISPWQPGVTRSHPVC